MPQRHSHPLVLKAQVHLYVNVHCTLHNTNTKDQETLGTIQCIICRTLGRSSVKEGRAALKEGLLSVGRRAVYGRGVQ